MEQRTSVAHRQGKPVILHSNLINHSQRSIGVTSLFYLTDKYWRKIWKTLIIVIIIIITVVFIVINLNYMYNFYCCLSCFHQFLKQLLLAKGQQYPAW